MKIKIANTTNGSPVIAEALALVNGRAESAVATAASIIDAATYAESKLHALGIPKNKRTGANFRYTSGGSVARSYKYSRIVNVVTAVRGGAGWYITSITKSALFPNQSGETKLGLRPEQIEIALSQVRLQFYAV